VGLETEFSAFSPLFLFVQWPATEPRVMVMSTAIQWANINPQSINQ
jgi:hypothetical protein